MLTETIDYLEGTIEDLHKILDEEHKLYDELEKRNDVAEILVVELWHALKSTSQVASDYFKAEHPEIKEFV